MSMETVHVPLGGRAYDIRIGAGLLQRAGAEIAPLLQRPRIAIVTERNVAARHLGTLEAALGAEGIAPAVLTLDPGEASKCWAALQQTVEWLIAERIARDDLVVAFGGGVIGDLAGFAAAILRRGVGLVQIPTTLLAQVDSSVGGKTGINSTLGKNLVGAFHQPKLVLADIDLLDTLAERDFRAGYAEVVKYGLLGDAGFFEWLEAEGTRLAAGDRAARTRAVRRSCEMKVDLVVRDETEQGDRALLNLGHTFGHALEAATGYSHRLLHGEAVSIGCLLAFQTSAALRLCPQEAPSRVAAHFAAMGLKRSLRDIPGPLPDANGLIALMAQDKKVRDGRPVFVLVRDIGAAFVSGETDLAVVREVLAAELAARAQP
ncbi:MAG TPA: 3-dehydroquinate synthase [Amaricoccus sp.]|uniref:3-dehydroquinate synthase n=1 Tax=Amaricoccus sp. TaxID=1872485 RepID=UPI002CECE4DC|nr:3-dehydroquinate synthase [Amaricoccus sp.]HMQ93680.1 3-dehydroquinate synthase [Amaricoccus sp.]HMR52313.1 3-dehydroquinate synthase [Amaricoccus sp.]HMR61033.1 3-dehydroquinate synthase [Amaricoccus sp.]HMT99234.1 3-dehydroquinate synthase [Amaricoccus sp.]